MPFYDYKCDSCGKVVELKHGMSEGLPSGARCGGCGARELRRVFHAVGRLGTSGERSHSQAGGHSCSSCGSGSCGSCH